MLDVKKTISKMLNWFGFRLDWSEYATNNTADTWVPVFTGSKIQHRVLNRNQVYDMSVQAKSQVLNVNANSTASITFDVSSLVSGYSWAILYCNYQSSRVIATNYYMSGTSVVCTYRNVTSGNATGSNAQLAILRWKVSV